MVDVDSEAWAATAAAAIAAVALYFSAAAARAARMSAREAAAIARVEQERREEERERRHEELAPSLPEVETFLDQDRQGNPQWWGLVTLPRDYTIGIEPADRRRNGPIEVFDVTAHRPCRFRVPLPAGAGAIHGTRIRIRFWPPRGPRHGPSTRWRCFCQRPEVAPGYDVADEATGPVPLGWGPPRVARGHWELELPLAPPTGPRGEHRSVPEHIRDRRG